ncbi:ribose ABC transporter permease [Faecalicatena orotica]|uniref:Ribose transport system permease protein n=2 Tax=Faecalicatena orotica TaxID=1544 RepID=A0A2Y9C9N2_9FIRM|nr:ribose transport system permease protein [Faecalicatena orotica]SSA54437.1 ribose transport system permease protein [Faecalicatena orotica]
MDMLKKFFNKFTVLILLIIVIAYFGITAPGFMTIGNGMSLLRQIAVLGILSTGFSMVMIAGGLDLSISSQLSLVSCATAMMIVNGVPSILACIGGIVIAVLISTFNGFAIVTTGMPAMICTLAMQQVLQGVVYIFTGASPVYGLPNSMKIIGQGYIFGIVPIPIIIMIAIFLIGAFILNRTYLGRYFYAVGSNEEATRLSGLSSKKIMILSYVINGIFVGLASIVLMSRIASGQPLAGQGYEMDVITACVVGGIAFSGGKGKMLGVVQGVLVMGVLSNGLGVKGVDSYTQLLCKGIVLIVVVSIDCLREKRAKSQKMVISHENKKMNHQKEGAAE